MSWNVWYGSAVFLILAASKLPVRDLNKVWLDLTSDVLTKDRVFLFLWYLFDYAFLYNNIQS